MLEVVLTVPFWFEMLATVTGAITGAMSASRAQFDLFGTCSIAVINGLCGGIIRDVLLQSYGIYAFQHPQLIIACIVTGIVVFYFGRLTLYLTPVIDVVDSLSVGMWAVIAAGKGLSAGVTIVPSIILAAVTSTGGGLVRDVIMNRPVTAFQPGSLYGTAVVVGTLVFCLMKTHHILDGWSALICLAIILGIRVASIGLGWHTRPARDLTEPVADALARPVRAITHHDLRD